MILVKFTVKYCSNGRFFNDEVNSYEINVDGGFVMMFVVFLFKLSALMLRVGSLFEIAYEPITRPKKLFIANYNLYIYIIVK